MNILTGKCKEDFETYYIKFIRKQENVGDRYCDDTLINQFRQLPMAMKYGVLVDFFDDSDIYISVDHNEIAREFYFNISTKPMSDDIVSKHDLTRPEARKQAIEKANELYNKKQ